MPPLDPAPPPLAEALVAEHFTVSGADLQLGGRAVRELASRFGTPLFIYDGGVMRSCYRALAKALEGFAHIHYSIKANPAPAIIRLFASEGAHFEIASVGEYRAARAADIAPENILFAGPAKRVSELEAVIADGIGEIHLESYEEIERVSAIGMRLGVAVPVCIRVNPVASAQGGAMRMGGKPAPFGFDEEDLLNVVAAVRARSPLDLRGVHLFAGTQILDADVLLTQWRHAIGVAGRVASLAAIPLRTIDLGGGLGIPYFSGEKALDLVRLSRGLSELKALLRADPLLAEARLVVEPGRFLAGPGGIYVVAINAVKTSRDTRFLVTDGGMHHHLAASGNLGQIIKRDYPIVAPAHMGASVRAPVTVVGPLCTPLDTLARKVELPELRADQLIAILQSGAYGKSASPAGFLSQPAAAEILVDGGQIEIIHSGVE
jgi:diaminopimelate decarboxylase